MTEKYDEQKSKTNKTKLRFTCLTGTQSHTVSISQCLSSCNHIYSASAIVFSET